MEVKTIFKVLMQVPCFIAVCYIVANIFGFVTTYFRLMATAQIVQQVVVENNYIPSKEEKTIAGYLLNQETAMLGNTGIIVGGTDGNYTYVDSASLMAVGSDTKALNRRQYGNEVTCGVRGEFQIIWPLLPNEQLTNDTRFGMYFDGNTWQSQNPEFQSESELEAERQDSKHSVIIPLEIVFTVPGLKYYPDMLYT